MRARTAFTAAIAMAFALGSTILSAQSARVDDAASTSSVSVPATPAFAVLEGVTAAPMAAVELDAVKGLHVHFVTPSQNNQYGIAPGFHLAGDIKTENNWSNEWGGTDGEPVAPSYKGLCKAVGLSGPGNSAIVIPFGEMQCPL